MYLKTELMSVDISFTFLLILSHWFSSFLSWFLRLLSQGLLYLLRIVSSTVVHGTN